MWFFYVCAGGTAQIQAAAFLLEASLQYKPSHSLVLGGYLGLVSASRGF